MYYYSSQPGLFIIFLSLHAQLFSGLIKSYLTDCNWKKIMQNY